LFAPNAFRALHRESLKPVPFTSQDVFVITCPTGTVILLEPGLHNSFDLIRGEGKVGLIISPNGIEWHGRGASCLAALSRPTQPLVAVEKPFETFHLRSRETGSFGESFK
jgi:hypothetical protein